LFASLTECTPRRPGSFLIQVVHHQPISAGAALWLLRMRFHQSVAEYHLDADPLFFGMKMIRRVMLEQLYNIGRCARLIYYDSLVLRRRARGFSEHVIRQVRSEQVAKLLSSNRALLPLDRVTVKSR